MASDPIFTATPKIGKAALSVANAGRDGTGTIVAGFTAGASGSRAERAMIKATGTTTAGMIRIFLHDGASSMLLKEIPVTAITPNAITPSFEYGVDFAGGIVLPSGWSLRFSTEKAEAFAVTVFGGDF